MQRVLLAAAFALGFMLAFGVHADEAYERHIAGCARGNQDDVVALAERNGGTVVGSLNTAGLASATALYNDFPPETADTFDYAWALDAQNGAGILVLASEKGKCVGHFIAKEAWPRVRAIVLGRAI